MARKEADLTVCTIVQALQPDYWNLTPEELKVIVSDDVSKIADMLKARLENGGCEISDMYAIIHDKDSRKTWDSSLSQYTITYKTHHIHCIVKFKKGSTLSNIAGMVGLEPQYILKAERGSYAYDNALSYLIHIKYPEKYQYDPKEVFTVCGRSYMDIYLERKDEWMKGRAKVQSKKSKADIDWLEAMILEGEVTKQQIMLTDEYYNIYARNKRRCDDAFDTYGSRKVYKNMQALDNGEFKLTVYFIMGETGAGKTRMAKILIKKLIESSKSQGYEWQVYSAASSNSLDDYKGEDIVFMDDLRGAAMCSADWLKLLDAHNISPTGARYHNKTAACRVLIITSTIDPVTFFYYCKQVGGAREPLDQFMRRIESRVKVMKADDPNNFDDTMVSIADNKEGDPYRVLISNIDPMYHTSDVVTLTYGFPNEIVMPINDGIDLLTKKVIANNNLKKQSLLQLPQLYSGDEPDDERDRIYFNPAIHDIGEVLAS